MGTAAISSPSTDRVRAETDRYRLCTIMNFAVDGDTVIVYQPLALLAAAETLRLDVFEQLHG